MNNTKKQYELTTKGKIIIAIAALLIIGLIIFLIIPKGDDITRISIEMVSPNEGIVIDDPVLGMSTELKVGKKIKLSSTIYPENHKNIETEYIVENPDIAYVNEEDMIVGKKAGKTKLYMTTKSGKTVKSNEIEITIVD